MEKLLAAIVVISLLFLTPAPAHAIEEITFNEVMAAPNSGEEWIELYNSTATPHDLTGWIIKDSAGNELPVSGTIEAFDYLVITSTDILNNSGDSLTLYTPENYPDAMYTFGSAITGRSFARIPDGGSWKSNQEPTKGSSNGPEPTPVPKVEYDPIIITEIYPSTNSGQDEWVEFFNPNNQAINLDNWYITDNNGDKKHLQNVIISADSYAHFNFSPGYLNNDGDTVTFFNTDGKEQSKVKYPETPKGYSWALNDDWCHAEPSESADNTDCVEIKPDPTPTPTPEPTATPTPEPSESPELIATTTTKKSPTGPEFDRKLPKTDLEPTPEPQGQVAGASIQYQPQNLPKPSLTIPVIIAFAGLLIMGGVAFPVVKPRLAVIIDKVRKKS